MAIHEETDPSSDLRRPQWPKHVTVVVAGGGVVTPDGIIGADLIIEGGYVVAIDDSGRARTGTVIDATDLLVAPGFIDLQINGGFGYDFTSDAESIWKVGARLPESGVTAFLPTIITSPRATITKSREVLASGPPDGYLGAAPLGLHLEGPMLSPRQLGTHDPASLQAPGYELVEGWSTEGHVRMVTLAPELPGAYTIIETLNERGVIVSLGHSDASYEEGIEGIRRGASFGTHLHNAMSSFHHRDPGLIGALLVEPSVTVGMIVDGVHLHPAAVQMAWNAKKPDRVVLVTDGMAAMGLGRGAFDLGSADVIVDETGSRNPAGDLAGSTLSLERAIRNFISSTGCSEAEAIAAATTNPARVLGEHKRGKLEVGAHGDVAVVDSDFNVKVTVVAGDVAFAAPDAIVNPSPHEGSR